MQGFPETTTKEGMEEVMRLMSDYEVKEIHKYPVCEENFPYATKPRDTGNNNSYGMQCKQHLIKILSLMRTHLQGPNLKINAFIKHYSHQ